MKAMKVQLVVELQWRPLEKGKQPPDTPENHDESNEGAVGGGSNLRD